MVNYTELMTLQNQFAYIIDNNPVGKVQLGNIILDVYTPEKLRD